MKRQQPSWNEVGNWYQKVVGEKGHYFHQKVILPNLRRILNLKSEDKVLDLGCGEGVVGRNLVRGIEYVGVDTARFLIEVAKKNDSDLKHKYLVADAGEELSIGNNFSHGLIVLALQNMSRPFLVIKNAAKLIKNDGKLVIVLNHPIFRIPQSSHWGVDKDRQIQYRRIDRYLSPIKIEIEASPFKRETKEKTISYHYPLSTYSEMLFDNGFVIEKIEEWVSDKTSTGSMAKIEDRARKEFPLFMAIIACRRQDKIRRLPAEQNL